MKKDNDILKAALKKLSLTQQQVADLAEVNLRHYQMFESGKRSIVTASFSITCRVLEALHIDVTTFIHNKNKKNNS